MEAKLMSLLDQDNLERAIQSRNFKDLADFARFLAAFFTNLPILVPKHENVPFPRLYELVELQHACQDGLADYTRLAAAGVAARLPARCTAPLTLRLLQWTEQRLDALLFADHFEDLRAQLALRHLLDLRAGTRLLAERVLRALLPAGAAAAEAAEDGAGSARSRRADALLHLAVLFEPRWLAAALAHLAHRLDALFADLEQFDVDDRVALPRPPIYVTTEDYAIMDDHIMEVELWKELGLLIQAIVTLMNKCNWTRGLVGQLVTELCRVNRHFSKTTALEDQAGHVAWVWPYFTRLLRVVLRAKWRDAENWARRRDAAAFDEEPFVAKLSLLRDRDSEGQCTLTAYLEAAEPSDVDEVLAICQHFRDLDQEQQRFLPPLTDESLDQWRMVLLNDRKRPSGRRFLDETKVIDDDDKQVVSQLDMARLDYIAYSMPHIPLAEPDLIGISLQFQPDLLCKCLGDRSVVQHAIEDLRVVDRVDEYPDGVQPHMDNMVKSSSAPRLGAHDDVQTFTAVNERESRPEASLHQRIRGSLRRLGGRAVETPPHLDEHDLEQELLQEQDFIANLRKNPEALQAYKTRILSMGRPKIRQAETRPLRMAKSPGLVRRSVTTANFVRIPGPADGPAEDRDTVSDELKAISARLSRLKAKWSQPFDAILKERSGEADETRGPGAHRPIPGLDDHGPIQGLDVHRPIRSLDAHGPIHGLGAPVRGFGPDLDAHDLRPRTSTQRAEVRFRKDGAGDARRVRVHDLDELSSGFSSSSASPVRSGRRKKWHKRGTRRKAGVAPNVEGGEPNSRDPTTRVGQARWRRLDGVEPERSEPERLELERLEPERLGPERLKPEHLELERMEPERPEPERLKSESPEPERLELESPEPEGPEHAPLPHYSRADERIALRLGQLDRLPSPRTPPAIAPLDLGQLSDGDEARPRHAAAWHEVQVFERPSRRVPRIVEAADARFEPPDWLRLLPFDQKPASTRLLTLDGGRDSRSASSRTGRRSRAHRKSPYLKVGELRDSGFVDHLESARSSRRDQATETTEGGARDAYRAAVLDLTESEIQEMVRRVA